MNYAADETEENKYMLLDSFRKTCIGFVSFAKKSQRHHHQVHPFHCVKEFHYCAFSEAVDLGINAEIYSIFHAEAKHEQSHAKWPKSETTQDIFFFFF